MTAPPRLRIQRGTRRWRWTAWDEGESTPVLDHVVEHPSDSLDQELNDFHRLTAGSWWSRTPDDALSAAVESLSRRLASLIPPSVADWLDGHRHVVVESVESTIPWELAELRGKPMWRWLNVSRSHFPTREKTVQLRAPLRCLLVTDSDGTLTFNARRAELIQERLEGLVEFDLVSDSEASLERLSQRLLQNDYQALFWNATHLCCGPENRSHIYLYDRPVTSEMLQRELKGVLPPLVILGWHSLPDLSRDTARCQEVEEWAILARQKGARVVLATAWDHQDQDLLWCEALARLCRGGTLLSGLRVARQKFETCHWSHSLLIYADEDLRLQGDHP